jgi:PKD repeat protein
MPERCVPDISAKIILAVSGLLTLTSCGGGGGNDSDPINDTVIQPAKAVRFTDFDLDQGELGGTIAIDRAENESGVTEYVVYWSNDAAEKLQKFISISKPNSARTIESEVADNTAFFDGATHWLVVTKNTAQEMNTGVSTRINDLGATDTLPAARDVRFKDSNGKANVIDGEIIISPPSDESNIVGYRVHWADNTGNILPSTASIASALKSTTPKHEITLTLPANTAVPVDAQRLLVASYSDSMQATTGPTTTLIDFTSNAEGIGPGGNRKNTQYDYGSGDRPALAIHKRNVDGIWQCVMDNGFVMVVDMDGEVDTRTPQLPDNTQSVDDDWFPAYKYTCGDNNKNTYKEINQAWSPLNDAFYFGTATYNMFYDYLDQAPLEDKVRLRVHYGDNLVNASWDGAYANFGDGNLQGSVAYPATHPFTVLDVIAHEIAHGFTYRYSKLKNGEAKAINEGFSDIVGEAAKFYLNGSTDWKHNNSPLREDRVFRYFAYPSDDGKSIESLDDYALSIGAHLNAGIFRKTFYLLVNSSNGVSNWSLPIAMKAFAVANQYCWQSDSTFTQASQCVVDESWRLLYDFDAECFNNEDSQQCQFTLTEIKNDLRKAFAQVDIDLDIGGTQALFKPDWGVLELRLTDNSMVKEGNTISSKEWDFGDGIQSTEDAPIHEYSVGGRYPVALTITDNENNTDTYIREISIANDYCDPGPYQSRQYWIAGVSMGNDVQYSGNTLKEVGNSILGLRPGTEIAVKLLTGKDKWAADQEIFWQIWIDYDRDGEFDNDDEYVLETSSEGDLESSIALPTLLPQGKSRMRVVMRTGGYLTIPCNRAGTGEVEDYNLIFEPANISPLVDFSVDVKVGTETSGAQVSISNQSLVFSATNFEWDFGDGSPIIDNEIHPTHIYSTAGDYSITLRARINNEVIEVNKDVTIELLEGYCRAGETADTEWERIRSVTFNNITHDSDDEDSGYRDYTEALSLPMTTQTNIAYEVQPWFGGGAVDVNWRVWIDFNQNLEFDQDELVMETQSDGVVSGILEIPANTALGQTRMRVMFTRLGSFNPCYEYDVNPYYDGGQVEDYRVDITQ